jgi:hypothetical protein
MLHDGLGYLAVLSASNVFNLIFYFPHAAGPAQDVQVSVARSSCCAADQLTPTTMCM